MTTLLALVVAAAVQAPPSAATVEANQKQFQALETKLMGAVQLGTVGSRDLSGEYVLLDLWGREDGAWKIRYRVLARPVAPLSR
jgi:hypothetical protein